ncbi:calnexin isoform X2 [Xyrauchen texanus]|uniref:calnexin isoform X2 n=1 Tax=Xyrauchen texanus TaxID=154827 RepID=UPI002242B9D1|nr:calnexin isoform X2 [Xyrauchen texanus]
MNIVRNRNNKDFQGTFVKRLFQHAGMTRCQNLFVGVCLYLSHISGSQNTYRPVAIPDQAYFAEPFDVSTLDRNWVLSKAVKDEQLKILKYNGKWAVEEPFTPELLGNKGLVLKSPGRHHAIAAYLQKAYQFKDKVLCLQYEVLFQKRVDCGGAYIKLLSHSDDLRLSQFSDATPYTIMFGPDKCGRTHKVHFIYRLWNPITGTYEEKHARQPEMDLSDYFVDHRSHLYTLNLYPNNTFEILIDLTLINNGSLLEDMDSPATSEKENAEETTAVLVDRSQRSVPRFEQHDGSNDVDGECSAFTEASDCELLTLNPASNKPKKKSSSSPDDKGNKGEHFEDAQPLRLSPVTAVGFELWSLTGDVMFDNILLCDNLEVASHWTKDTWGQRQTLGMLEKLLVATIKRPWLWGVYVFTVGLPMILFISFMWPDKRFGPPDQDYYYKKTDEPQTDGAQDMEKPIDHDNPRQESRQKKEQSRGFRKSQTWS